MNEKKRQAFIIYNDGKHKFFFKPEEVVLPGADSRTHKLTFTPEDPSMLAEGDHIVVRKKSSTKVFIDIKILQRGPFKLVAPFALRFASGPLLLCLGTSCVQASVFAIDPMELECVSDCLNETCIRREIPLVLVQMQTYLYDSGGLDVEGIFRIAANEIEMPKVRAALNCGNFESCEDINCIATLIKVFFRQLPKPLLSDIPTDLFLNIQTLADSQEAVALLQPSFQTLLEWVVDLLCDVVGHGSTNKMSAQSCAIVMGPNLFVAEIWEGNPMQALMISQKAVMLLQHLILAELERRVTTTEAEKTNLS